MEKAGPETRWETRRNALEVLRKICKSIILCTDQQIRHEIMKDGDVLGGFCTAMVGLARGMTDEEREKYKKEGLYEKLEELRGLCDWEVEMIGLDELYEVFDGKGDGVEDREGDDDVDKQLEREQQEKQSAIPLDITAAPTALPS